MHDFAITRKVEDLNDTDISIWVALPIGFALVRDGAMLMEDGWPMVFTHRADALRAGYTLAFSEEKGDDNASPNTSAG